MPNRTTSPVPGKPPKPTPDFPLFPHATGRWAKKVRGQLLLLAVNTGMTNIDLAELDWRHLDLDRGVLNYPRPRTGIERRATLWPETIKALRKLREWGRQKLTTGEGRGLARYRPPGPADADAVFITRRQVRFVRLGTPASVLAATPNLGCTSEPTPSAWISGGSYASSRFGRRESGQP